MSDNRANIAIIGDRDSVMLFKAIGLAVYAENEALGASKRIAALARAGCKVIFITEPLFARCGETIEKYRDYPLPDDLTFLKGDYKEMYPDYISAINRLDYNVGRLVDKLKALGIYDDTIILYTSDHGCHFKTRNTEYKRSCHESSIHTPLIIKGGGFSGGRRDKRLVSLIDLPPTMLSMAGIKIPKQFKGYDLTAQTDDPETQRKCVFMQISESQCGRAVRTDRFKYSVRDINPSGYLHENSRVYFEDYLYDLKLDPNEKNNLVKNPKYAHIRREMKYLLFEEMQKAGEEMPVIFPAIKRRKK